MLNLLKEYIELKSGYRIDHQIDCKKLSDNILDAVGSSISPSTLRRFYGFLPTNSQPSLHTLNVLSQYSGYKDWETFQLEACSTSSDSTWLNQWERAQEIAREQTLGTCNSFHNRNSVLPIIHRQFADAHFRAFLSQEQSNATALIAPSGYGKSAMLVKWCERALKSIAFKNDIILFVSALTLEPCARCNLRICTWLNSALGFSPNYLSSMILEGAWKTAPGRIIVVIDGIDELHSIGNKAIDLGTQLKEFIERVVAAKNIRFILSSRLTDWLEMIGETPNWFMVHESNFSILGSNIPPFSEMEIQQVFDQTINLQAPSRVLVELLSASLQENLSYPYYLQIFVETYERGTSVQLHDRLDLLNGFLKRQVFDSEYSDEKADILRKIVELSEFGKNGYAIRKNGLKEFFPIHLKSAGDYHSAYSQLRSFGIIQENLVENQFGTFTKMVGITNRPIFELLLTQGIIEAHGLIDFPLFQKIEKEYKGNELSARLLSFLFELGYKLKHVAALSQFFNLKEETLSEALKLSVVQNCLRHDEFMRRQLLPIYAKNPIARKLLFEEYLDLNYLATSHLFLLDCYQKGDCEDGSSLNVNTLLCFSGFMSLNYNRVQEQAYLFRALAPHNLSPLTSGLWFSNKLLGGYFGLANPIVDTLTDIERFSKEHIEPKGPGAMDTFAIGLSFGLVLTKTYKFLSNYFKEFDLGTTGAGSPNQKVLFIVRHYTHWQMGETISKSTLLQIENYLSNLPYWCSFHPTILAKAMIAISSIHSSNPQKAYETFRKASEISNNANYKIYEVKLLKRLSEVLRQLGESNKAEEFEEFAKSLIPGRLFDYNTI